MIVEHRWFQLVAALVAMVMIANLQYAWTLFVEPIHGATGWRLSDIQFAFTLFVLLQVWTQPLDGWLIDRLGPRGFMSAAGLLCGLVSPLSNGASRIFWGWASDRAGREPIMIIAFALQSICLYLTVTVGPRSPAAFTATLVLVYFTWGQIFALFPAITGDCFGVRHATSNYAVVYTAKGAASILGGWVGAVLFEQSGQWTTAFYGSAVMAAIAAALAVGLRATATRPRAAVRRVAPR